MEELYNMLLSIVNNSPTGEQLTSLDTLDGTEKFLLFKPGVKRPYLIQKDKITFPGEVPDSILDFPDAPNTFTGQKGKVWVVNETENGLVYKSLGEVTGITAQAIIDALGYTPADDSEVVKSVTGSAVDNTDPKNPVINIPDQQVGGSWGSITGTLEDQTDLFQALEGKANDSEVVKESNLAYYKIPENELSATPTDANVKDLIVEWFIAKGHVIAKGEIFSAEIVGAQIQFITPVQNLDALSSERNSTATYINSSGVPATAALNELRIDYSTGSAKILVEPERTNLVTSSQTGNSSGSLAKTLVDETDPYGVVRSIVSLVGDAGETDPIRFNSFTTPLESNTMYALSCWVKNVSSTALDIRERIGGSYSTYRPLLIADGWVFVEAVMDSKSATSFTDSGMYFRFNSGGQALITDLQFEKVTADGLGATSRIPTSGGAATRRADVVTTDLLEDVIEIKVTTDQGIISVTEIPPIYQLPVGKISQIEFVR